MDLRFEQQLLIRAIASLERYLWVSSVSAAHKNLKDALLEIQKDIDRTSKQYGILINERKGKRKNDE